VAVSVLTVVVVIPALARLLLPVLVSSAVVVSEASFDDNFGTAGSMGFIVAAITAIVDSDARSLLFFLSTSMTNGSRFFQDKQLFSEVGVCVGNLDLGGLLETSVSFVHLSVLHVHSFSNTVRHVRSLVAQRSAFLPSLVWRDALPTFACVSFKIE
jgi:hypothetical protein